MAVTRRIRSGLIRSGLIRNKKTKRSGKTKRSKKTRRHMKKMWGGELTLDERVILTNYLQEAKINQELKDRGNEDAYLNTDAVENIVKQNNKTWDGEPDTLYKTVKDLLEEKKSIRSLPATPASRTRRTLPQVPIRLLSIRSGAIKGNVSRAAGHSALKSPTGTLPTRKRGVTFGKSQIRSFDKNLPI